MKPCDIDELVYKIREATLRKQALEARIQDARNKPYISERERNEIIARILGP